MRCSPIKSKRQRLIAKALIVTQVTILIGIYFYIRTPLIAIWTVLSFVPAIAICYFDFEKRIVLISLLLLFVSQHAIFVFAQPIWGFSFGSDSINDLHTASVIYESDHFELGQAGYTQRVSYSYFPLLHIFSAIIGKISLLPLAFVATTVVPMIAVSTVTVLLYNLNSTLWRLKNRSRNMATLLFATLWYFTSFQSGFVRETYAFPLALLCLWVVARIIQKPSLPLSIMLISISSAVVLSHFVTSLMVVGLLSIMTFDQNLRYHNRNLNRLLLIVVTILLVYNTFVILDYSVRQATYAYRGLERLFDRSPFSVLKRQNIWGQLAAYSYYAIMGTLTLVGMLRVLRDRKKKENGHIILLASFFVLLFLVCVLLRFSTSADPWSWTYYMSLRGTIWAFIGISFLAAIAMRFLISTANDLKRFILVTLLVSVLAAGKFSQFSSLISDPTLAPYVTDSRHSAAMWLKAQTNHGLYLYVTPYQVDFGAFEASRSMAPYAYLKEYFASNNESLENFKGYMPFFGFSNYTELPSVQIVYDNKETQVGFKGH